MYFNIGKFSHVLSKPKIWKISYLIRNKKFLCEFSIGHSVKRPKKSLGFHVDFIPESHMSVFTQEPISKFKKYFQRFETCLLQSGKEF